MTGRRPRITSTRLPAGAAISRRPSRTTTASPDRVPVSTATRAPSAIGVTVHVVTIVELASVSVTVSPFTETAASTYRTRFFVACSVQRTMVKNSQSSRRTAGPSGSREIVSGRMT